MACQEGALPTASTWRSCFGRSVASKLIVMTLKSPLTSNSSERPPFILARRKASRMRSPMRSGPGKSFRTRGRSGTSVSSRMVGSSIVTPCQAIEGSSARPQWIADNLRGSAGEQKVSFPLDLGTPSWCTFTHPPDPGERFTSSVPILGGRVCSTPSRPPRSKAKCSVETDRFSKNSSRITCQSAHGSGALVFRVAAKTKVAKRGHGTSRLPSGK